MSNQWPKNLRELFGGLNETLESVYTNYDSMSDLEKAYWGGVGTVMITIKFMLTTGFDPYAPTIEAQMLVGCEYVLDEIENGGDGE